jgi:hypothetical protein
MSEIRFQRRLPGACPQYKNFVIQDRYIGRNLYGNDCYEYSLFYKIDFEIVRRFRTRKQAYQYLSDLTGLSRLDIKMGSASIIRNDGECLGLIWGNTMYRLYKRTRVVERRPVEDEQITGWFEKFSECLAEAKEIIRRDGVS